MSSHENHLTRRADRFVPPESVVHLFRVVVVGATVAILGGAYVNTAPKDDAVAVAPADADDVKTAALSPAQP